MKQPQQATSYKRQITQDLHEMAQYWAWPTKAAIVAKHLQSSRAHFSVCISGHGFLHPWLHGTQGHGFLQYTITLRLQLAAAVHILNSFAHFFNVRCRSCCSTATFIQHVLLLCCCSLCQPCFHLLCCHDSVQHCQRVGVQLATDVTLQAADGAQATPTSNVMVAAVMQQH